MKLKLLLSFSCLSLIGFQAKAQVCLPQFLVGCIFDQINSFSISGENSTVISTLNTGCSTDNYGDYTNLTVDFNPGSSYTAAINSLVADDNVQVFIDFNDDDVFSSSESVGGMNGIADLLGSSNVTLTIPSGAASGLHTMRVIVSGDGTYPTILSCPVLFDFYGGGEVHDYMANITGTVCNPPTGVAATGINHDGATINWTAVVGATGYEYVVDQLPGNPVSGTAIVATTYAASGLLSGTMYYFHIRTNCGGGNFSTWVTIPFTTLACPVPTGVTETAITATSATVSWTAVPGAQGYQYAVNTSMTPPTTGTYTTNASVPVTGLTAMTTYHTWVRTVCGVGDTSAWNAMHMWTTLPVSVVNVGNVDFALEAYPNPVKNILTVAANGKGNVAATIQLTDLTGKLMNSYELKAEQMDVDMSGLSSGVYFIRYTDNAHRQTIKIIKE